MKIIESAENTLNPEIPQDTSDIADIEVEMATRRLSVPENNNKLSSNEMLSIMADVTDTSGNYGNRQVILDRLKEVYPLRSDEEYEKMASEIIIYGNENFELDVKPEIERRKEEVKQQKLQEQELKLANEIEAINSSVNDQFLETIFLDLSNSNKYGSVDYLIRTKLKESGFSEEAIKKTIVDIGHKFVNYRDQKFEEEERIKTKKEQDIKKFTIETESQDLNTLGAFVKVSYKGITYEISDPKDLDLLLENIDKDSYLKDENGNATRVQDPNYMDNVMGGSVNSQKVDGDTIWKQVYGSVRQRVDMNDEKAKIVADTIYRKMIQAGTYRKKAT